MKKTQVYNRKARVTKFRIELESIEYVRLIGYLEDSLRIIGLTEVQPTERLNLIKNLIKDETEKTY